MEKADEEYKKALDTAKKYKLKDDIDNLTEDYKYTEIVLDGDKDLEGKKYDDALDKYVLALEKSGEAEEAGSDYVLKKIDIAKECVKVADLLTLADKQYDDNDLDGALKNYLDVKDLAVDYYLKDEKKEAMDKIQKIYDQKAADAKQKRLTMIRRQQIRNKLKMIVKKQLMMQLRRQKMIKKLQKIRKAKL